MRPIHAIRFLLATLAIAGQAVSAQESEETTETTLTIPADPPGGTAYQRVRKLLPPHVGCAVMVLGKDSDGNPIEFKRGFGVRRLTPNGAGLATPVTPATNFRVASFTKVLTAAAVLRLADQEKLSLDDSLCDWLPAMPAVYRAVTLRSLLDHTSGVPAYHGMLNESRTPDCSDLLVLRAIAKSPRLQFPAGTRCDYSNSAYVLLGLIVQQASGSPFHDYLRDEVLRPLGMKSSGVLVEGLNTVPERAYGNRPGVDQKTDARRRQLERMVQLRAQVVQQGANRIQAFDRQIEVLRRQVGTLPPVSKDWHEEDQNAFSRLGGDGALYTSLDDLQALFTAVEQRSPALSSAAYDLWLTPSTSPAAGDRFGDAGRGRRFACGWMVDEQLGEPRYSHRGATRGFRQTIQWMPKSGRSIVVLMNSVPPGAEGPAGWDDALIQQLGETLMGAVLEPPAAADGLEALREPIELGE